ncbi:MAG TPA: phenylalanine--tRNA ligase subunit beta [Pyrinomonadaceae bacterium]|nr:phenylalanine--tRNA ligase subunit beta [Pyrinomonadaceae bacterium]
MNISYNWLRELTGTRWSPQELRERLTMIGLAVDSIREADDDYVLDVEVPSNRPDCLSHLGVAREVVVMEGGDLHLPETGELPVSGLTESLTSVEIRDADLCPRYAARIVRGVRIGASPDWMVKRLEAIGQRPINNVADITNYVLHELGQPHHAFDLEKLSEHRIVVRRAEAGEKLRTLDGIERELDEQMLIIADALRAVAIAGVMGGEETEISETTRDVLIESAYFDPASVRRTARMLGLHTEASHRFERGADYGNVLHAQERVVELICELAGGTATEKAVDAYPKYLEPPDVSLRPERVKALTGLDVAPGEMERILNALGFARRTKLVRSEAEIGLRDGVVEEIAVDLNPTLTFVAPTWRTDILIEEDLVEEVARHAGYEKIKTELPASSLAGEYQPSERKRRGMRRALTACGFDEAISFSFIDSEHDDRFEFLPGFIPAEGGEDRFVTLSNPIIEGAARMRPSLLPGLLDAVRHNFNHGTRDVRLFETGRIFAAHAERGQLPREREALALVATGVDLEEGRAGAARELDFYDLKGALEAAADAMNISALRFEAAHVKHLREGQAARISVDGRKIIGTIGRLDDRVAARYKFRQPVYVAEVDFSALLQESEAVAQYKPLPRYPSVVRDVSLLVELHVTLAELLQAVFEQRLEYVRDAKLVDVYEGANVPEGKRSVTLRLEYRADERTLRDEEADLVHAQIVNTLKEKFDAQLRG